MEVVSSTGVAYRFEWLVNFHVKGGGYCKYCFLLDHLTREYAFERSGESTVVKFTAAKDKDGVLTNHAQTRYHQDACVPSKALLSTHIHPNTRNDAATGMACQFTSARSCS